VKRLLWASGGPARSVLFALLGVYRVVISPLLGERCRFYPSCGAYAAEAIRMHGAVKGSALSLWRLLRCNPLTRGGTDPCPKHKKGTGERGAIASVYDGVIRGN
jgi:uncharacterized protein